MNTIAKLSITTLTLITLTACNSNEGKGKQNSSANQINQTTTTKTTNQPYITKLTLSLPEDEINKDTSFAPTITATYSNNTTKELQANKVEWIFAPSDAIEANRDTLKALKDTNATIQAKLTNFMGETILSNKTNLSIYWEVNGHRLPPEPDPKINNSTLLGIDSNNNGVRDDVERWIYEEYKDKHPIYAAIAMETIKAYRFTLLGEEHYKEAEKAIRSIIGCESYYRLFAEFHNEKNLINEYDIPTDDGVVSLYLNTAKRREAYSRFDASLSGRVFTSPKDKERKEGCPASIKEALK